MPKLKIGNSAPEFEALSTQGVIKLSDYLGKKNVVLCFYIMDDTPGCNLQLTSFKKDIAAFEQKETQILAINGASLERHQKYTEKLQFPFPLVADQNKSICKAYGVLVPFLNIISRTVMILDKQGIIQYNQKGLPSDDVLLQVIDTLNK